jgi:hypothetical protein
MKGGAFIDDLAPVFTFLKIQRMHPKEVILLRLPPFMNASCYKKRDNPDDVTSKDFG